MNKLKINEVSVFVVIVVSIFTIVLGIYSCLSYVTEPDYALAEVGDSVTITANITPAAYPQDVEWKLEWDEENTNSTQYGIVKKYDPLGNVGMEVNGNEVTLTLIKYHTFFAIKTTVYMKLTCTSAVNSDLIATCLIKIG